MARRATALLASGERLLLADLVLAECLYVLESFYEVERTQVAALMRAAIALPAVETLDPAALLRALEVYEVDGLDFADAYLVAQAEATGVGEIVSFDRSIDRVVSITRREPRLALFARSESAAAASRTAPHRPLRKRRLRFSESEEPRGQAYVDALAHRDAPIDD